MPPEQISDSDVRKWTDIFEKFQNDYRLEPHHNVEISEYFSHKEIRNKGEICYYFPSTQDDMPVLIEYELAYSQEMLKHDLAVVGGIQINSGLTDFVSQDNIGELLDRIEVHTKGYTQGWRPSFVGADQSYTSSNKSVSGIIEIPLDHSLDKVGRTVEDGFTALNKTTDVLCETLNELGTP